MSVQARRAMTDQDEVPDTSDRLPASPCPRSPRSLRSAAVAVGLTGALILVIPLGLLLGRDGLVPVSVNRQTPIPAPHLLSCSTGALHPTHQLTTSECVKVAGAGFEPGELIQVSDSRRPTWHTFVRADPDGRFALRHLAGAAGTDVLTFVGLNHSGSDALPRVTYCRLTVSDG